MITHAASPKTLLYCFIGPPLEVCSFYNEKVASEWRRLYAENKELSYYSSYEFNILFLKSYKNNKHRKNMKPFLIRVYNEDETLMFLPLSKSGNEYYMMWDYSSVLYCEPVHKSGLGAEFFDVLINKLPEILGNEVIYFTKLNDGSAFTKYLGERYTHYKRHTCMSVELGNSYKEFYDNMPSESKATVDDLREKMRSEGISFKTYFYSEKPITQSLFEKLYYIYYGAPKNWREKLKNKKYDKCSPVSCSLRDGKNSILAISCINEEPVAFVGGFVRNGTVTVVRQGKRRRYNDYEPYKLLLCDFAKYCIEKKKLSKIDFGKGREAYKQELGAKAHYTYYYEIKL